MLNTTILIGRLTKTPENKVIKRKGKDPLYVCDVILALNASDTVAYYIPVTFFGKIAEVVCKYCDKGDKIAVNGYLKSENWEDDEGKSRSRVVVVAQTVEFMSRGKTDDKSNRAHKKTDKDDEAFYYDP